MRTSSAPSASSVTSGHLHRLLRSRLCVTGSGELAAERLASAALRLGSRAWPVALEGIGRAYGSIVRGTDHRWVGRRLVPSSSRERVARAEPVHPVPKPPRARSYGGGSGLT